MGKRDREKKDIKRLQLRREVIRVLADDSLKNVGGGWGPGSDDPSRSPCIPSK